jgi:hypothetical protein
LTKNELAQLQSLDLVTRTGSFDVSSRVCHMLERLANVHRTLFQGFPSTRKNYTLQGVKQSCTTDLPLLDRTALCHHIMANQTEHEASCARVRLSDTAPYAANPCQELTAPESVDFAKVVMGRLQDGKTHEPFWKSDLIGRIWAYARNSSILREE